MEVDVIPGAMTRIFHNLALAAALIAVAPCVVAQSPPRAAPPGKEAAAPDFAMSVQQEPFLRVADDFIAASAAGDMAKAGQMLSPAIAASSGPDVVANFLAGEVRPFFAQFTGLANSVSVTRTADVTGFVFYMYMVTGTGALRPFVIYVIEEDGAKVVANVLVDRFVEGRHCARVGTRWNCPDFG
jgi:hypothetical protein